MEGRAPNQRMELLEVIGLRLFAILWLLEWIAWDLGRIRMHFNPD